MRHRLLAAAAAFSCVSLVPAAQAQEKVTLRYGQIANSARSISSVGLYVGQRKGFFAKEGITLEIVGLRGVQYQIEELDKGNVDVSHTATPYLIQAVLNGSPSVAIVGGPANTIFSMIAKPEIKSYADLKGKLIGMSLPVDTISIASRMLLEKHGLKEPAFRTKELIGTPIRAKCLTDGECDAVPLGQPDDIVFTQKGYSKLGAEAEVDHLRSVPDREADPRATSRSSPVPVLSSTLTGSTRAPGATPATPIRFPVTAVMIPETCVPCPWSSWAIFRERRAPGTGAWNGQREAVFASMFEPGTRRRCPRRSGCRKSAPVSTTATMTPAPRVVRQASGALIAARPHCAPAQRSFVQETGLERHDVSLYGERAPDSAAGNARAIRAAITKIRISLRPYPGQRAANRTTEEARASRYEKHGHGPKIRNRGRGDRRRPRSRAAKAGPAERGPDRPLLADRDAPGPDRVLARMHLRQDHRHAQPLAQLVHASPAHDGARRLALPHRARVEQDPAIAATRALPHSRVPDASLRARRPGEQC